MGRVACGLRRDRWPASVLVHEDLRTWRFSRLAQLQRPSLEVLGKPGGRVRCQPATHEQLVIARHIPARATRACGCRSHPAAKQQAVWFFRAGKLLDLKRHDVFAALVVLVRWVGRGSGKWEVGSGGWGVGSVECGVGSGEWMRVRVLWRVSVVASGRSETAFALHAIEVGALPK